MQELGERDVLRRGQAAAHGIEQRAQPMLLRHRRVEPLDVQRQHPLEGELGASQEALHLVEREPELHDGADLLQARHLVAAEEPVPGGRPAGRLQEADLLVVVERAHRDARAPRDLSHSELLVHGRYSSRLHDGGDQARALRYGRC
jgi:hypothetical protein